MWCTFVPSIETWCFPLSCFSESIPYLPSFFPVSPTGDPMVQLPALCPYTGLDTDFHLVTEHHNFLSFQHSSSALCWKSDGYFSPPRPVYTSLYIRRSPKLMLDYVNPSRVGLRHTIWMNSLSLWIVLLSEVVIFVSHEINLDVKFRSSFSS